MSARRLAAAREAQFETDRRVLTSRPGNLRVDHELAAPPFYLERRDGAAAVALEEIADESLQVLA